MMHPDTEIRFLSEEFGHGVVAIRKIPKGTITWFQDELDHFEIAACDILPGEELTDDYDYLNISEAFKAKDEGAVRATVYHVFSRRVGFRS